MTEPKTEYCLYNLHQLLVAVDLSPFSLQAFRWAMSLGEKAQAEVTAVHVIPPMLRYFERLLFPYAALGADRNTIEAELLNAAKDDLGEALAPVLGENQNPERETTEIYQRILLGPVIERIKESILETSSDLVICGAFGQSSLVPGQLGSIARRLVTSNTRPTLLIKEPIGRPNFKRMLVALDGSRENFNLLRWALSFAQWFNAEVEIATILPEPSRDDVGQLSRRTQSLGEMDIKHARNILDERLNSARANLRAPFPYQAWNEHLPLTHHIKTGDPLFSLLEIIEDRSIDLIVIASRSSSNPYLSRFGRVTDGICRLSSAHTLVIPVELLPTQD